MRIRPQPLWIAGAVLVAAVTAGCTSGGGSDAASTPASAPASAASVLPSRSDPLTPQLAAG